MKKGLVRSPPSRGSRYCWVWPILAISVLSFCVHLWPQAVSPYPLNNDSLVECSVARDIVETGTVQLPGSNNATTTHSESTPVWNVFLAFVGSAFGMDPMFVAQYAVASVSMIVPLITFVLLLNIGADRRSALVGSFFVALFGTFLYLSASSWKLSLGVQLYVLLMYFYTVRSQPRMRLLMVLLLLLLPFVHHLVAIIAYITLVFLTGWTWFYALRHGVPRRSHYYDLVTVAALASMAFGYYYIVSLDRISYIGSSRAILLLATAMLLVWLVFILVLTRQSHSRWTFAPIPAVVVLAIGYLDYSGYLFDYTPSQTAGEFYVLVIAASFMIFVGWFGFETILEHPSRYRAIPLAMLLPVLTLIMFAIVSPTVENKHQFLYRTFDFANPALALGIGMGLFGLSQGRALKKYIPVIIAAFLALLVATVPYGIYTEEFTGVRHDTQAYEIDAFEWTLAAHVNGTPHVNSDERISYIAWTLYGLGKDNTLPRVLETNVSLVPGVYNFYEQFWSTRGVNDFPNGLRKPSPEFMSMLTNVEDVIYVGGPVGDQLLIVKHTWIGQIQNNWYYPYDD